MWQLIGNLDFSCFSMEENQVFGYNIYKGHRIGNLFLMNITIIYLLIIALKGIVIANGKHRSGAGIYGIYSIIYSQIE